MHHSSETINVAEKLLPLGSYLKLTEKSVKASDTASKCHPAQETKASETIHRTLAPAKIEKKFKNTVYPRNGHNSNYSTPSKERLKACKELPIWPHRSEIQAALRSAESSVLILIGETGSGKSTQVPQFLSHEPWCQTQLVKQPATQVELSVGGVIAVTQPRRVAATTLAHRVSREVGTPLGMGKSSGLVGYSVRFDHKVPRGTKIKFLTEGTLLRELLQDPHLRQYSAVVIDEIHERSVNVDLLVGFLKQIITGDLLGRAGIPLKVVIMSATADVCVVEKFFKFGTLENGSSGSVRSLRIKGRQHPVDVIHELRPVSDVQDALLRKVFQIHMEEAFPGDILAFLAGQDEIESAQKVIEEHAASLPSNMPAILVRPLFGQLPVEGQQEAFLPIKTSFTRKLILATNLAETSVTIPGVRYVIDSGKAKIKSYRPRLGMESLLSNVISKSSACQRSGRAGREAPGKCFRLYTESTFASMREMDLPEILRIDVLGAVLAIKARGIQNVLSFPLMDSPDAESIEKALLYLYFLGALCGKGAISPAGEQMARLPVPVPFGAVLLEAAKIGSDYLIDAIDIISCITSGDDIFLQLHSEESQQEFGELRGEVQRREGDIITYLTILRRFSAETVDRTEWCKKRGINLRNMRQALNIRKQLRAICAQERLIREAPPLDPQIFHSVEPVRADRILKCFMRSFASKTAMLAPDASYLTIQGKHVITIHPSSVLHGQKREAIMFLENVFTNKSYAKKVSAIRADWIVEALAKRL